MRLLSSLTGSPIPGCGARSRYNAIRQLSRFADIDLVAQINTLSPEQAATGTEHLKQFCNSVESVPAIPYSYSLEELCARWLIPYRQQSATNATRPGASAHGTANHPI